MFAYFARSLHRLHGFVVQSSIAAVRCECFARFGEHKKFFLDLVSLVERRLARVLDASIREHDYACAFRGHVPHLAALRAAQIPQFGFGHGSALFLGEWADTHGCGFVSRERFARRAQFDRDAVPVRRELGVNRKHMQRVRLAIVALLSDAYAAAKHTEVA
jgi:hypothetical protein